MTPTQEEASRPRSAPQVQRNTRITALASFGSYPASSSLGRYSKGRTIDRRCSSETTPFISHSNTRPTLVSNCGERHGAFLTRRSMYPVFWNGGSTIQTIVGMVFNRTCQAVDRAQDGTWMTEDPELMSCHPRVYFLWATKTSGRLIADESMVLPLDIWASALHRVYIRTSLHIVSSLGDSA